MVNRSQSTMSAKELVNDPKGGNSEAAMEYSRSLFTLTIARCNVVKRVTRGHRREGAPLPIRENRQRITYTEDVTREQNQNREYAIQVLGCGRAKIGKLCRSNEYLRCKIIGRKHAAAVEEQMVGLEL